MFAGDGRRRDQVCARCGQAWSYVTTDLGVLVCGRCRGWHDADAQAAEAEHQAALIDRATTRGRRVQGGRR